MSQLLLVNADGTGLTQITDDATDKRDPAWSSDGSWIAFIGERSSVGIFAIRPDGSGSLGIASEIRDASKLEWRA